MESEISQTTKDLEIARRSIAVWGEQTRLNDLVYFCNFGEYPYEL